MSTLRTFASEPLYCRAIESAAKSAESYGEGVVKLDCYAVLGLSPAAEDVVIRAAYLALMRSYHPDRNGSAEAAGRARAITEAYETIGNPVRRAEYDASRRMHQFEILGYDEKPEPAPRPSHRAPVIQWPRAPVIGAVAASALAFVFAVIVLPLTQSGGSDRAPPPITRPSTDKPVASEEAAATRSRATASRTTEEPSERVASSSSRPKEASPPPAPAARTLPEMATARGSERPQVTANKVPAKVDVSSRPRRSAEVSSPTPSARPAPPKAAQVDEKARIAALEGMSTSFYIQSVNHADDAKRLQLQQARGMFIKSSSACRSDTCVGDAHASYIRDMSRIMMKPKQPSP